MRKQLVAFRPQVLAQLEALLEQNELTGPAFVEEALQEVRTARAFYRGEGPVRLMPRKETPE